MLINKILRGLDLIELEDISRKLDIVIRAEKRGPSLLNLSFVF
jgi:hypothetical protein